MAFPELPAFLADELPFDRSWHRVRKGVDEGRRLHVFETGDPTGRPVLLLHGNPTWSFLWRRVMRRLVTTPNLRLIAPDLLGLGLSDRLPRLTDHSVDRHADTIADLLDMRELDDAILVGQDWGGPIVTAAAARCHRRIRAMVYGNTAVILPRRPRGSAFHRFARLPGVSDFVFRVLGFPQNGFLGRTQGDPASISGSVARAYRWPLRRFGDRIAPLAMARMVPDGPSHPSWSAMQAQQQWLEAFEGPVALVWGVRDPVLGRALNRHRKTLPAARVWETSAGHFLQEEVPDVLAEAVLWSIDQVEAG